MEEGKIQALHDTLSKLRKSAGLGVSSQYSWSAAPTKTDENGKLVREDGLPTNALYSNFVREGAYDAKSAADNKYGDGRVIKRNFDDCVPEGSGNGSSSSDEDSESRRRRKMEKRERKKARKRAAKLEAKRQAKLEEKRRLKRVAKKAATVVSQTASESVSKSSNLTSLSVNGKNAKGKEDNDSASSENAIKTAKKALKRQESGSMKIKELAKAVVDKIGGEHNISAVKKLIKKSDKFEVEGKVVRLVKERNNGGSNTEKPKKKKKRKRDDEQVEDPSEPASSSVVSTVPSSPPPRKRRKKDKVKQ